MPISLTCACGKAYRVKDEYAGRKIRCSACAKVLEVPAVEEKPDAEQEAVDLLLQDSGTEKQSTQIKTWDDPPLPPPPPRYPAVPPVKTPPIEASRPKKSPRRTARLPRVAFEQGWFGSLNAGVVGGILMILIAVAWFVVGLWAGRIFFYPPILVVIGLGAILKGLFGGQ